MKIPPTVIRNVWFRPGKREKVRFGIFTFRDIGVLSVEPGRIQFSGRRHSMVFDSIDDIQFGTQGNDFINRWVEIRSGNIAACFADGGWLGWRGVLAAGTLKILRAIAEAFPGIGKQIG